MRNLAYCLPSVTYEMLFSLLAIILIFCSTQNWVMLPVKLPNPYMHYLYTYHRRHEPILVARKTLTKSSTYVKFVMAFEAAANPAHNLILCGSHDHDWYG